MKKTKIEYPKQKTTFLRQKATNDENFEKTLLEENQRLKQQIDEIKNQKDLGLLGGNVDTSNLQAKLTAGQNITISDNNVISATDTTYTAGTNITITNGVISATGGDSSSFQSQIDSLQTQINNLQTPADPNYNPQTPSDYPAGTILKTYDFYERDLNMESNSTLDLPIIYYCAEPQSSGIIKVKLKFQILQNATDVLITISNNGTQLSQEVFQVDDIDTMFDYEKTFYDVALNQNQKGNELSISMALAGSGSYRFLNIKYYKAEFFAANVDIINKICPFDVAWIDNKYYLSNCQTGVAMIAQNDASTMTNINSLTWTNSEIEAQNYLFGCAYTQYNSNWIFSGMGYAYVTNQNKRYINYQNEYLKQIAVTYPAFDWQQKNDSRMNYIYNNNTKFMTYYHTSTSSSTQSYGSTYQSAKVVGMRFCCNNQNITSLTPAFINIDKNGQAELMYAPNNMNKNISLGYATDATLFLTSYTNSNTFGLVAFLKVFDKIIKKEIQCTNATFSITSTQQIGNYDKFYLMPNNDYFVVRNDALEYHKFVA